jgi:hypothetical protein
VRVGDRGKAETLDLRAVTRRVDAEDDRQTCIALAQTADAAQELRRRAGDGGEKTAPGKDDGDLVRDARQLRRQVLDGGPNIEKVGEMRAIGAPGEMTKAGRVRIQSDEETGRRLTGEDVRKPAVAGAEIDRDAARKAGECVSESVIGALEALAADDVHHSI